MRIGISLLLRLASLNPSFHRRHSTTMTARELGAASALRNHTAFDLLSHQRQPSASSSSASVDQRPVGRE
jgi:hypothetical protein